MVLAINYRPEVRLHLKSIVGVSGCAPAYVAWAAISLDVVVKLCIFYPYLKLASYARCLLLQVMMGFIAEWEPKLGVKIVCSQVRFPLTARPAVVSDSS